MGNKHADHATGFQSANAGDSDAFAQRQWDIEEVIERQRQTESFWQEIETGEWEKD